MSLGKTVYRSLIASLLLMVVFWPSRGQAQSALPQATIEARLSLARLVDTLVQKNSERADALQKYQGRRFYTIDYKGFPATLHAEMVVDMTYDAPATKQFKILSQTGPEWLVDKVLKRLLDAEMESTSEENRARVALNPSNYEFSGLEHFDVPGSCSYAVQVEPKIPSKLLYRGRIWVDSRDFAVCRIDAEPSMNPSFWIKKTDIHHSYLKIGDFWLPAKNESVSMVRGGGRAVLTIDYQNYEILAARAVKGSDAPASSASVAAPVHGN